MAKVCGSIQDNVSGTRLGWDGRWEWGWCFHVWIPWDDMTLHNVLVINNIINEPLNAVTRFFADTSLSILAPSYPLQLHPPKPLRIHPA